MPYYIYDENFKPVVSNYNDWTDFMNDHSYIRETRVKDSLGIYAISSIFIGLRTNGNFECAAFYNGQYLDTYELRTDSIEKLMSHHMMLVETFTGMDGRAMSCVYNYTDDLTSDMPEMMNSAIGQTAS